MARLLEGVRRWLPIETGGEWSIEANPLDVTHENLKLWSSLGINRISLGGQSFQARKLMVLERDHSPEQLSRSIHVAAEWLRNVSLDLIFAAPEETLQEWEKDLALVLEHPLKHVSTYGLTYEKGARFWSELHRNRLQRVDEEVELAMYEAAIDTLSAGGIEQYEVSNFAVPGWECVHNQAYWNGDRWWGFGPSAAGYLGKTRCVNHRSTLEYIRRIERGTSAVAEVDTLSEDQQWRERFVFGMRRRLGVPWSQWRERVPKGTRELIDRGIASHLASGWLEVFEDRVRLTRAGLVVSDGLWHAYLDGEV